MKNNNLKNISRNMNQNFWQVRVTRNGIERSKAFSDSKMPFQSAAIGLSLAMEYRDALMTVPFNKFVKSF